MSMAAAPKTTMQTMQTRAAWIAHCVQLAEDRHSIGAARYIGTTDAGDHLYRIPSRTHDGCYLVTVYPSGTMLCGCQAGVFRKPCSHVGAVLKAEEQRVAAERETGQSEAWSWWLAGGEWDR
jgi:hypothetical protein